MELECEHQASLPFTIWVQTHIYSPYILLEVCASTTAILFVVCGWREVFLICPSLVGKPLTPRLSCRNALVLEYQHLYSHTLCLKNVTKIVSTWIGCKSARSYEF